MRRRLLPLVAAALATLLTWAPGAGAAPSEQPAPAAPAPPSGFAFLPGGIPQPRAVIVVDADTGHVLLGDNIHQPQRPASTVKLFTALAAVERMAPDAPVSFDTAAANVETNKIGGLGPGTKWPLDTTLAALMMVSANDAAYGLAYTVGGSLDGFAADLNETAKRLGTKDSILGDPAGLDDATAFNGGPYTSAYDLAIATRNAMTVPELALFAATRVYDFTDPQGVHHHLENHNRMLSGASYGYDGATGFKTGFTQQAQHTFVGTASRNGRTLISVVLGAVDTGYPEAAALLDAGFAVPADRASVETLPVPAVSLYSARAADRDAFTGLATAPAASSGSAANGAATDVPASFQLSQAPRAATPVVAAPAAKGHSRNLLSMRNVVIVLILLGIVTFLLRRRAVRRRRARRLARRKQRMAAMRSGGLPVVDGRYRAGLRVGQPLESHVRVRPLDDDLDPDALEELRALDA